MRITKHGVLPETEAATEQFICEQCNCEFTADYDEYYIEKGSSFTTSGLTTYVYTANVTDIYVCFCPECHKIVMKTKTRQITNPTITVDSTETGKNNVVVRKRSD